MGSYLGLLFVLALFSSVYSSDEPYQVIKDVRKCTDTPDSMCKVLQVRVKPCKEALKNKPCKFKIGSTPLIEFDYIANFTTTSLHTQAYSETALVDLPLAGMDVDGCKFTKCPIEPGVEGTFNQGIFMSSVFPPLKYTVKWRLWDNDQPTNGCCFTFKIQVVS